MHKTAKEKYEAALKELNGIVELAKSEDRDLTEEETSRTEELIPELETLKAQMDAGAKAAEAVARLGQAQPTPETPEQKRLKGGIADRFVDSPAFKSFRESYPEGSAPNNTPIHIEAKGLADIGELLGKRGTKAEEITTETGRFVSEQRLPGYRSELLDEPLNFLNLITTGNTAASYLEYARIISETDGADIVPEGELKPLSDVTTDDADAKAYTYADGFVVTNQTLSDDGALVAFMESRVRFHVLQKVVDILLNGSGTGTEPAGLLNITGVQQQPYEENALVTLARAIEKVQDVQATPQAIVLNPSDAWSIRLMKNNSGDFYAGGPFSAAPFTPWGVRTVTSNRVAKGTALVGNFSQIQWLQREPLSVLAFNQHEDFARRNKTYVRAEIRGMQLFMAPREVVVAEIADGSGGGVEG